ncbi:MAG: hypothetical protein Q7S18_02770 [bacterium]|nr:hypothetical protein [bacterium]
MRKQNIKILLLVVSIVALTFKIARADLDSPGSPGATGYTLNNIYSRLQTNATSTEGDHTFGPSADPAPTFHTLKEIYDLIPTILPATVKSGTSYLGVSGMLTPDGGTAGIGDLFNGKTAHLTNDWNLDIGTLNLACNTGTFDGLANKAADAYDGSGNGTNRWCITNSGDVSAAQILSGKIAWVDGTEITGIMANNGQQNFTPGIAGQTITEGYHNGTGAVSGDADLVSTNIKSGVNIFGVAGDSNVVNTSSGDAIAGNVFSGKIAWVDGMSVTGSMANIGQQNITPGIASQTITLGYHDGTGTVSGDADLVSTNIRSGVNIFGIDGNLNVVNTSSGDAIAGNVLSGKVAWVDGAEITGSMANIVQQIITPSTTNQAITLGYHDGTGYAAGDADLVAGKIKSGVNLFGVAGDYPSDTYPLSGDTGATDATAAEICNSDEAWTKAGVLLTGTLNPTAATIGSGNTYCGVAGTLLKDEKNGSAGVGVADSAFYTQALGGVDDYNNGGTTPADAYQGTWTTCNAGNSYCNTSDATYANKKDNSTGLVWSIWLDAGTSHTWFWANNCYEPGTAENPDGGEGGAACDTNGDNACQCVKKPDPLKVGCESIAGWRTPYQKELMQAYIDGSWANLSSAGNYFWSSSTYSYATQLGWFVSLYGGYTDGNIKTSTYVVRCVR